MRVDHHFERSHLKHTSMRNLWHICVTLVCMTSLSVLAAESTTILPLGDSINPLSPHLRSPQRRPQAPHPKSKFLAANTP
jgi:hypothetical protein